MQTDSRSVTLPSVSMALLLRYILRREILVLLLMMTEYVRVSGQYIHYCNKWIND